MLFENIQKLLYLCAYMSFFSFLKNAIVKAVFKPLLINVW